MSTRHTDSKRTDAAKRQSIQRRNDRRIKHGTHKHLPR